jgi:hypothetical protein
VPHIDIVVRYRPLSGKTIEAIQKRKADPEDGKDLTVAKDALITACDRVFVPRPPRPARRRTGPTRGWCRSRTCSTSTSGPVKLSDPRLAEALGYEATTARQIVGGLFPTDGAVLNAFQRINVWNANVDAEVTEGLSGE